MIIKENGDIETQDGHLLGRWRLRWTTGNYKTCTSKHRQKSIQYCQVHGLATFIKRHYIRHGLQFVCLKCKLEKHEEQSIKAHERIKRRSWDQRIWKCRECGELFTYLQLSEMQCLSCRNKIERAQLEDQQLAARKVDKEELLKYKDLMRNCKTGVCDILKIHHEALKDDPERLKTDHMIEMICGIEMKERYLEKKKKDLNFGTSV